MKPRLPPRISEIAQAQLGTWSGRLRLLLLALWLAFQFAPLVRGYFDFFGLMELAEPHGVMLLPMVASTIYETCLYAIEDWRSGSFTYIVNLDHPLVVIMILAGLAAVYFISLVSIFRPPRQSFTSYVAIAIVTVVCLLLGAGLLEMVATESAAELADQWGLFLLFAGGLLTIAYLAVNEREQRRVREAEHASMLTPPEG